MRLFVHQIFISTQENLDESNVEVIEKIKAIKKINEEISQNKENLLGKNKELKNEKQFNQ